MRKYKIRKINKNNNGVIILGTIILLALTCISMAIIYPLVVNQLYTHAPPTKIYCTIIARDSGTYWYLYHSRGERVATWKLFCNYKLVAWGTDFHIGDCIKLSKNGYIELKEGVTGQVLFWGYIT